MSEADSAYQQGYDRGYQSRVFELEARIDELEFHAGRDAARIAELKTERDGYRKALIRIENAYGTCHYLEEANDMAQGMSDEAAEALRGGGGWREEVRRLELGGGGE